ncbi:unnamed protein product [Vitrella brassicaformis CCMP3155]|uniref:Uncharacterized protein n=1 Tax=Vitrella brassicaformis (strain CCMP3155) TaxID=1169540 RepID=A0A0G4ESD4_VITBC|nr:unnamed protein product [Vitrella brassicaformis CCMP3155]|eukprot:CEM00900.1 unnamed protein product [Vitrella brassicaformis CCMP3155]
MSRPAAPHTTQPPIAAEVEHRLQLENEPSFISVKWVGGGTSGEVVHGKWKGRPTAFKVFKLDQHGRIDARQESSRLNHIKVADEPQLWRSSVPFPMPYADAPIRGQLTMAGQKPRDRLVVPMEYLDTPPYLTLTGLIRTGFNVPSIAKNYPNTNSEDEIERQDERIDVAGRLLELLAVMLVVVRAHRAAYALGFVCTDHVTSDTFLHVDLVEAVKWDKVADLPGSIPTIGKLVDTIAVVLLTTPLPPLPPLPPTPSFLGDSIATVPFRYERRIEVSQFPTGKPFQESPEVAVYAVEDYKQKGLLSDLFGNNRQREIDDIVKAEEALLARWRPLGLVVSDSGGQGGSGEACVIGRPTSTFNLGMCLQTLFRGETLLDWSCGVAAPEEVTETEAQKADRERSECAAGKKALFEWEKTLADICDDKGYPVLREGVESLRERADREEGMQWLAEVLDPIASLSRKAISTHPADRGHPEDLENAVLAGLQRLRTVIVRLNAECANCMAAAAHDTAQEDLSVPAATDQREPALQREDLEPMPAGTAADERQVDPDGRLSSIAFVALSLPMTELADKCRREPAERRMALVHEHKQQIVDYITYVEGHHTAGRLRPHMCGVVVETMMALIKAGGLYAPPTPAPPQGPPPAPAGGSPCRPQQTSNHSRTSPQVASGGGSMCSVTAFSCLQPRASSRPVPHPPFCPALAPQPAAVQPRPPSSHVKRRLRGGGSCGRKPWGRVW